MSEYSHLPTALQQSEFASVQAEQQPVEAGDHPLIFWGLIGALAAGTAMLAVKAQNRDPRKLMDSANHMGDAVKELFTGEDHTDASQAEHDSLQ